MLLLLLMHLSTCYRHNQPAHARQFNQFNFQLTASIVTDLVISCKWSSTAADIKHYDKRQQHSLGQKRVTLR